MKVPAYATSSDLAAWMGLEQAPAGAVPALRSACNAVREATITWFFPADPATGIALDADVAAHMANAVLYQAAALLTLEVDLAAGGTLDAVVETGSSLGSARQSLAGANEAAAARAATIVGLCPEARRELRLAGIATSVWIAG